ncbi:phosphatidate cytidylyltransferase 4, chloroplastic-like isoform X3 [Salvia splendens]|uniref:phosphatidate cytidylyltransferase 4, chloroplastic-like isoform X3 n=1 Tax=Salvia splendens TaxID=180675 RepID=UPI001C26E0BE|nr:phosphatidate cytidylyltransferase 4, chloroplastic-like isoform X3 [Salvia splendens]
MASQIVELDRIALIPLSVSFLCTARSHSDFRYRPTPPRFAAQSNFQKIRFNLDVNGSGVQGLSRIHRGLLVNQRRRVILGVASAEQPDQISGGEFANEEVQRGNQSLGEGDIDEEHKRKTSQLRKRIIFGMGIGVLVGGVVLAGQWVFTVALSAAVFAGSREYFELRGNPRFSQLSSTMFGLFYCGYLPSFWVKLRCGLAAPTLNTRFATSWPLLLGGNTMWTVGLMATLISISSIIAADTFAFIGGKAFGRTPLTAVSPKKTWEGALVGLGGCITTSVLLAKVFCWPTSTLSAVAFGFLNFFGSLFGDLTESMIKRDAGVKDSGSLIPGHGGILDRVDSYIFTGALAHSFVKTFLPLYGI